MCGYLMKLLIINEVFISTKSLKKERDLKVNPETASGTNTLKPGGRLTSHRQGLVLNAIYLLRECDFKWE